MGVKLGKILASAALKVVLKKDFDLIVPVPLHRSRLRMRGYNKSDMIAKGIAEVFDIPHNGLIMIRQSPPKHKPRNQKLIDGKMWARYSKLQNLN